MSRILFLTPQMPFPPHQGAAIRNLNVARLAAQRHEVAIYGFVRAPDEQRQAEALREWVSEVRTFPAPHRTMAARALQTALSPTPDMGRRLSSDELASASREAEADLVQAEAIEMAQFLSGAPGSHVLDCHNAEWMLQKRTFQVDLRRGNAVGAAYSLLQWLKLRRYERLACRASDAVIAVSEDDRRALLDLDRRLTIDVVPNAVDAALFSPATEPPRRHSFVFTGTLDFRPNVDAMTWLSSRIWPLIRRSLPDAQLTLAGREPVSAIRQLHGRDGIEVAASPADIRPLLARAAVYLIPVRAGGGSRFKLLEAMSMGLGVVSTTIGAEGLDVRAGEHVLLADEPQSFAAAAVELAGDAAERQRLGAAARELVLRTYDWPLQGPRLWAIWDRLLSRRTAAGRGSRPSAGTGSEGTQARPAAPPQNATAERVVGG